MEHDLWLCPALITKEKKAFPGPFILLPLLCCSFLLLDDSPAAAGTPSSLSLLGGNGAPCQQWCPGCNYRPEGSPVAWGIFSLHLLWIFWKNWWSKACWPHCSPPFLQNPWQVLSYKSILHAGTPLALQQMAMQHCPLPRWASSFFHRLHLTMKQQKKREKNPTWQLICGSLSPVVGSQQYEHINSNNWGISKGRSPETAGPCWHGGHSPEDNLQSQLKFQPQIPKQLRFPPDFLTGGTESVPLVQHWNGTFSWHCTFPIYSLHPLSSHCVSALACFWAHDAVELKKSSF